VGTIFVRFHDEFIFVVNFVEVWPRHFCLTISFGCSWSSLGLFAAGSRFKALIFRSSIMTSYGKIWRQPATWYNFGQALICSKYFHHLSEILSSISRSDKFQNLSGKFVWLFLAVYFFLHFQSLPWTRHILRPQYSIIVLFVLFVNLPVIY
jgi:hypothetical protein